MANEINIQLDSFLETGLTVVAKVFNKTGTQQGSDISLTETSAGFYSGDFNLSTLADGDYVVKFQTTTEHYGSGILSIKGGVEAIPPTKAELDSVQTSIEGNIAALNDISSSDVQTAAAAALTSYDAPTKAELDIAQTEIQSDIAAQQTTVNNIVKNTNLIPGTL